MAEMVRWQDSLSAPCGYLNFTPPDDGHHGDFLSTGQMAHDAFFHD